MIFIPTVVIGLLGGALGAGFTFLNLKVSRFRKRVIEPKKYFRILEPIIICLIMAMIAVYLPAHFKCKPTNCAFANKSATWSAKCLQDKRHPMHPETNLHRYTCGGGGGERRMLSESESESESESSSSSSNTTEEYYNPAASLLFVTGESAVEHLFSRNTQYEFDYASLFSVFLLWFPMACWCAGSAVASGLVVPILIIGAAFGRICGLVLVDMTGDLYMTPEWNWIDPGAFALIGASAFFGGVSRLTISLTVIMMEITNDIRFLLPIMSSILVSKLVADTLTHSLYHALLEIKCIPFIGSDPPPSKESLDFHPISTIMSSSIVTLLKEGLTAKDVVAVLNKCKSNSFPIVDEHNCFHGMVLRKHVLMLLKVNNDVALTYEMLEGTENDTDYVHEVSIKEELKLLKVLGTKRNINFNDIVDTSAVTVRDNFPILRAFIIFRSLGLRHMTIVNSHNCPVGMVTRKELLGMHIEHGIHSSQHHGTTHDVEHDRLNPLESQHVD